MWFKFPPNGVNSLVERWICRVVGNYQSSGDGGQLSCLLLSFCVIISDSSLYGIFSQRTRIISVDEEDLSIL